MDAKVPFFFFGASRMFALNEAVCMEALFAARAWDVYIRRGDEWRWLFVYLEKNAFEVGYESFKTE